MVYTDYEKDIVSDEEFSRIYKAIRENAIEGKTADKDKCTIILGGQPGAGKSTFYEMRDDLVNYIAINGDEYRRFHPNYEDIVKTDPEHYSERTQPFSNRVVETLISDLGKNGYNLIIEGTLRNPEVPIHTCNYLKSKGYEPNLVVIACDAEAAWLSTLSRASLLKEQGLVPRLVPIDIYNRTVNNIPESLQKIEEAGCFKSITVVSRDGEILFPSENMKKPHEILKATLHLDKWNEKLPEYKKDFIKKKIEILELELKRGDRSDHDER
jgi:UDP-N-acetylglucosamine kinase